MDNECDLIGVHWNVLACGVELVRLFQFWEVLRKFPATVYNMGNEGLLFELYFFLLMSVSFLVLHCVRSLVYLSLWFLNYSEVPA